ncbi:hydantoinase/oxoprolinase family protein [Hwanghaeella sp.]|uniref:hydantoinase/oxoprolinase family protein n=1 Tax=Hwanghaeella sp. TaxID=2605943 RepID=UPI003CCC2622
MNDDSESFQPVFETTSQIRVAVDIGGTFTDLQFLDENSGAACAHKVPTTPADPSEGLVQGIREASGLFGFDLDRVGSIMHGTTIATNAVLQRKLPAGALITTRGFRDVLEIGRHLRRDIYASKAEDRFLLIPRSRRFEVTERTMADGSTQTPLAEAELRKVAEELRRLKVETVAVVFLHAYANPRSELRAAEVLADLLPGISISCSHEVSPEIREFERSSTTALNALLMPVVRGYLDRLSSRLAENGITAPVFLVQSNGGVTTPGIAARQPARLLLSGPAGGARAAEVVSDMLDEPNLIAVDMGGTSYDVSIVAGGRIRQVTQGDVDGLPVRLPMIEIRTIGAGGGSIASADETGRLMVGPESAGAVPGPVCYSRGGSRPTVTDANAVLGRFDPDNFLGGAMTLDVDTAAAELERHVALPLGLERADAASGIVTIAVSKMAAAIRLSLFEKGLDPEDFALVSFGGASGLHACETAEEIGSRRVVFPRDPGTLSAWGMLFGDIVQDLARARPMPADDTALEALEQVLSELVDAGHAVLEENGVAADRRAFPVSLDMRYPGQAYEIGVPLNVTLGEDLGCLGRDGQSVLSAAVEDFHASHMAQFNHADRDVTPDIVTIRVAATGRLPRPVLRPFEGEQQRAPGTRRAVVDGRTQDVAVYWRDAIGKDAVVTGPAIIEETHSTHFIPTSWTTRLHPSGALIAVRDEVRN